MISQSIIKRTMIRLLPAFLSRKNPFFYSVQTDSCIQTLVLPNRFFFIVILPAQLFLPMPPPEHVPFSDGSAPEEGTPRVSGEDLRGARARRTGRRKDADWAPTPEENPPDEHTVFRVPAP